LSFLPPSTNTSYEGSPLAAYLLTFLGLATLGPGLIHTFLPDGGAGVIAGIDLSRDAAAVIGVFAWAGATQIVWGITLLVASLRYRPLVPPLLALLLLERSLIALNLWLLKAPAGDHRPPAAYATLAVLPLLVAGLGLSLRTARPSRSLPA
jgi:hypothetical protein